MGGWSTPQIGEEPFFAGWLGTTQADENGTERFLQGRQAAENAADRYSSAAGLVPLHGVSGYVITAINARRYESVRSMQRAHLSHMRIGPTYSTFLPLLENCLRMAA